MVISRAERDLDLALEFAQMAAEKGSRSDVRFLGDLINQVGGQSDESIAEAVELYTKSAMLGDVASFARLSEFAPKAGMKILQEALHEKELYNGRIDGIAGRKTKSAFSEFCASMEIASDCAGGISDPASLRAALSKGLLKKKES